MIDNISLLEPQGLDEAANNYGVNIRKGYPRVMDETDKFIYNAFKAGAKWMAQLGITIEGEMVKDINNNLVVSAKSPELKKVGKFGDKVIIQVRKI